MISKKRNWYMSTNSTMHEVLTDNDSISNMYINNSCICTYQKWNYIYHFSNIFSCSSGMQSGVLQGVPIYMYKNIYVVIHSKHNFTVPLINWTYDYLQSLTTLPKIYYSESENIINVYDFNNIYVLAFKVLNFVQNNVSYVFHKLKFITDRQSINEPLQNANTDKKHQHHEQ